MKRLLLILGFTLLVFLVVSSGLVVTKVFPRKSSFPTLSFKRYEMSEDGVWAIFQMQNKGASGFSFSGKGLDDPCYEYHSGLTKESVEKWEGWCGTGRFNPYLDSLQEGEFAVRPLEEESYRVGILFWEGGQDPFRRTPPTFTEQASEWIRTAMKVKPREQLVWSDLAPPPPVSLHEPNVVEKSETGQTPEWYSWYAKRQIKQLFKSREKALEHGVVSLKPDSGSSEP